jgi:hypothetical protein
MKRPPPAAAAAAYSCRTLQLLALLCQALEGTQASARLLPLLHHQQQQQQQQPCTLAASGG